jgi:hypothetical protein
VVLGRRTGPVRSCLKEAVKLTLFGDPGLYVYMSVLPCSGGIACHESLKPSWSSPYDRRRQTPVWLGPGPNPNPIPSADVDCGQGHAGAVHCCLEEKSALARIAPSGPPAHAVPARGTTVGLTWTREGAESVSGLPVRALDNEK